MWVFLAVPHVDGLDADYFRFHSLDQCVAYIKAEEIEEYRISSYAEIPEDDYTLLG